MKKHAPFLPEHPQQKTEWVVFNGRRELCPVPWIYILPNLVLLKMPLERKLSFKFQLSFLKHRIYL